jgi:hypothetical protein
MASADENLADEVAHGRLVFDKEDGAKPGGQRLKLRPQGRVGNLVVRRHLVDPGQVDLNRVPRPGSLSNRAWPPLCETMP